MNDLYQWLKLIKVTTKILLESIESPGDTRMSIEQGSLPYQPKQGSMMEEIPPNYRLIPPKYVI